MISERDKKIETKNNKISFPIVCGEEKISRYLFNKVLKKIKAKFNIEDNRAQEIVEDIIKMIISEAKLASTLEREAAGLNYVEWDFLREKSIAEVLTEKEQSQKNKKLPWFLSFFK